MNVDKEKSWTWNRNMNMKVDKDEIGPATWISTNNMDAIRNMYVGQKQRPG